MIQSFNHLIIQSSNQAIKQSSNQAIKQRYPVVMTFSKTHLKIPYFLLFLFSLTHTIFFNHLIQ
nr:hypothetical protein [Helicobacter pylori]